VKGKFLHSDPDRCETIERCCPVSGPPIPPIPPQVKVTLVVWLARATGGSVETEPSGDTATTASCDRIVLTSLVAVQFVIVLCSRHW
jgi:hypothetical protein